MRGFGTFYKKEITEIIRTYKALVLGIISFIMAIMNPLIAKLTPWLMEQLSDQMKEQGFQVGKITVTANHSWEQFQKNFSTLLIVIIIMLCSSYVKEYSKGTLIPLVTKGLTRTSVVLSKLLTQILLWTACFGVYLGVSWGYTAYYWNGPDAKLILWMSFFYWLFGLFLIAWIAFFSSFLISTMQVLMGVGIVYFIYMMLGMIGKIKEYLPTWLLSSGDILSKNQIASDYVIAAGVTGAITVVLIVLAVVFTKHRKL